MNLLSMVKGLLPGAAAPVADQVVPPVTLASLSSDYEGSVRSFYAYLPDAVRENFVNDALYHKKRYLDLLSHPVGDSILELGSDKPFISHFLRVLNPGATVHTISIDIPFSPYPITRVDIESGVFPFEDASFSDVIFTEVLEHLFRDPAWTISQINRVLRLGGRLFLTTPNACGYDVLVNLLHQVNPNGRNQFYRYMESGHPHLWTIAECEEILTAHGLRTVQCETVDQYEIPCGEPIREFLKAHAVGGGEKNNQVIRIVAEKSGQIAGPSYPKSLFPDGGGVRLEGALLEWVKQEFPEHVDPR